MSAELASDRLTLDAIDRRILAELEADGRASVSKLAERCHISRATAYARLERLQSSGVILGFTAKVDHQRAGLGVTAIVEVTMEQLTPEEMVTAGVTPDFIRLSVGLEDTEDILWDLDQALAAATK